MQQDAHALGSPRVPLSILPGAQPAHRDRSHEFQVARVEAQRNAQFFAMRREPGPPVAEMVFDIAPTLVVLVVQVGEFAKYLSGTLADDVG